MFRLGELYYCNMLYIFADRTIALHIDDGKVQRPTDNRVSLIFKPPSITSVVRKDKYKSLVNWIGYYSTIRR
jgi:hypothetical protein